MGRPKTNRTVKAPPLYAEFKPIGIPGRSLQVQDLSLDEFEALRLADYLGMSQEEAAAEMGVSRPTFARLIEVARKKSVTFLIHGRRLVIGGGPIHFQDNALQCHDCGRLIVVAMTEEMEKCPACGSTNLVDMAGRFGHGRCCRRQKIQEGL